MTDFFKKTERGFEIRESVDFQIVGVTEDSLGKIRDSLPGLPVNPVPSVVSSQSGMTGKGLIIKVAATHSGLITRNNTFYLPDRMRSGTSTWTDHYSKPIQLHHNDEIDPVGRVIAARYVDTTNVLQDRFKNHKLRDNLYRTADNRFWNDFAKNGPFIEKLRMVKLLDEVLEDPHYQGTGYIELTADITDPDAIRKIIDGRFLTGSTGAVSDKAVCSICNANWLEEDHCGHRPGRFYDGKRCFIIAGNLEYDEWSFVNAPADRYSSVIHIENSLQDSAYVEDSTACVLHFVPVSFAVVDSLNKEGPAMIGGEEADKKEEKKTSETLNDSASTTETDQTKIEDKVEEEEDVTTESDVEETNDSTTEEDPVSVLLDKLLAGETLSLSEAYQLYSSLELEDKLSEEEYKKLPKSSFVGSSRTFPVIDEAHFKAVSEFCAKYKDHAFSSSEEATKLARGLVRKGKALGISDSVKENTKVEDKKEEEVQEPVSMTLHVSDSATQLTPSHEDRLEELTSCLPAVLTVLSDTFGKDTLSRVAVEVGLSADPEGEQALLDEVAKAEDTIGELRDQLSALRRELSATLQDYATLEDRLVEVTSELHTVKANRLYDVKVLSGSQAGTELRDYCLSLSDSSLESELAVNLEKFDINKIADRFNNGLSRTPDETVDNPVPAAVSEPSTAETTAKAENKIKPIYATQKIVDEVFRHLFVVQKNPNKAKLYYTDAVNKGLAKPDPDKMIKSVKDKEE